MSYEQKLFLLVILLVVLPCIVLSTFAIKALLDQKTLIEQQIKESYTALSHSIRKRVLDQIRAKENLVVSVLQKQPWISKKPSISTLSTPLNDQFFDLLYVVDKNFNLIYPRERPRNKDVTARSFMPLATHYLFKQADYWEYEEQDFLAAVAQYQEIVAKGEKQKQGAIEYALISIARCYSKAKQYDKARDAYKKLTTLFSSQTINSQGLLFTIQARYQIAKLPLQQREAVLYYQTLLNLLDFIIDYEFCMPSSQYQHYHNKITGKLFELKKEQTISREDRAKFLQQWQKIVFEQRQTLSNEKALYAARQYMRRPLKEMVEKKRQPSGYLEYQGESGQKLAYYHKIFNSSGESVGYALYTINLNFTINQIILPILQSPPDGKDIWFTITTREGKAVTGNISRRFFRVVSQPLSPVIPFWQVTVYLKNIDSLEELYRYRSQIYFLGLTVVILILIVGVYTTVVTFAREIKTARLKSDFLSLVTHELKTPLTAIKMFVETLLMGRTNSEEDRKECLQVVSSETDRLQSLIERILSFAKMEQKRRTYHFCSEELGSIVEEVIELFKNQIPDSKSCNIQLTIEENLPPVFADRAAMSEVISNLLSNAYKYSDQNKEIEISCKKIDNENVGVVVKDQGMGIPKHELQRIFQKFYRIENPETRHIEGTGLGLSVVDSIVKAHKGKIKLQSKINIGSEFTIVLPCSAVFTSRFDNKSSL